MIMPIPSHPPSHPSSQANRHHWDSDAQRYHEAHPEYLSSFYWCPEMLSEHEARLLGNVTDATVLEIGCGSAPCANWLTQHSDARLVTGFDISAGMLSLSNGPAPLVQADILTLPYRNQSFDVAFSAFGALPFVADINKAFEEIARVLTPGGRFVFSVNHPMRWVFPDDPDELTAEISYFEREYLEYNEAGELTYAEYHRTFGDWVRALGRSGFWLADVVEPEWPADLDRTWGQWSPKRGAIFPGTAIFVAFSTS